MPFKSKAQLRKFYSDPKLRPFADEFLKATSGRLSDLPERARPPNKPKGGQRRGKR